MKYLRSYLLVPGAGGQILGSRSSVYRPLRRLTTTHRHSKVTSSNYRYRCVLGRHQVSTDGAKKSQLAAVGQVATVLPPPNGAEIEPYVQRHSGAKSCPRDDSKSYSLDQACPRHGNPYFSVPKKSPELPSYGQFLSEAKSLKPSLDPISIETAFLPTFHTFRNDIGGMFFAKRPKSAGIPFSSSLDAIPIIPNGAEATDSEFLDVERSKSLEALLPTTVKALSVGDLTSEMPTRDVKREVVLPRHPEPTCQILSQGSFDEFLEVHNFQKRGSEGDGGDKTEDICPFPKSEDIHEAPSGSIIIQSDRSSVIIHRDLYITNRILEKLRKLEENQEITPEPPVKTSIPEHLVGHQFEADKFVERLIESDSATVADIAESAVALDQPSAFGHSAVPAGHPQGGDSGTISFPSPDETVPCATGADPSSKLLMRPSLLPHTSQDAHFRESDSQLTNIEFGMPSDRMSAFESIAMQARKNLYARMKNTSLPCVLVDGVHVKHVKLEDVVPGLEKVNRVPALGTPAKAETKADSNGFILVSRETNAFPEDVPGSPASPEMSITPENSNLTPPETKPILLGAHEMQNHSMGSLSPESATDFKLPCIFDPFQLHPDNDSQFKGLIELPQSGTPPHHLDQNLVELESDKLQNELEDWFIPLGKEIESMLLTLEASKSPLESPEQNPRGLEETALIFEEEFPDVRDHETCVHDGFHSFEDIEIIESALLSPRGQQPFESGQARDKNTSASGSLPPKSKNPNIDIKAETTIKCCRSGNNTDINVTETQRYLDKRLPYPFCTETVLQVYGTSDSLSKATKAVENSKAQLVHLSNANSPNSGMLTPKLQFNHMLSKSHENFKPNSQKTVLKIKVVPNTETSSHNFLSSEPKPQPSHILQLTEQPSDMSTDVSKLIRRSKFNQKTGQKKVRRGESVMKLRPKKKVNKESSENIKILSPKDLEKMFPSPPKPKPIEKPRKVTIETKMGKESPDLIKDVEEQSTQGFMAAHFKSRKVQDDILKKPFVLRSQTNMKVVNQSEVQVATSAKPDQVLKEESDAALSTRDQKILKSIISHKVKDSFMAVTKKADLNPEVANDTGRPDLLQKGQAQVGSKPITPIPTEPKTIIGIADQMSSSVDMTAKPGISVRAKSPISQTVESFSPPGLKYDVDKSDQVFQNDPKVVYSSILGTAKEKPVKEKVPPKVPRPKSPRPESPTPKPNREYVTIKTEPTRKTTAAASKPTPEQVPQGGDKKTEKRPNDNVLPLSASSVIANVMKSSSDLSQSESRWRHLDKKTASTQNPNENFSREKPSEKSTSDVQRRPRSGKSNAQQKVLRKEKTPEIEEEEWKTSPNKPSAKEIESIGKMDEKLIESLKDKKVWNLPSEPLFFPFETPNFKELLQERPSESRSSHPIPPEGTIPKASADTSVYEADFCKLCTENTPGLAQSAPARYRVPLDRMKNFPLVNPGKAKGYSVPTSGAVSISPLRDLMLMRNLTQVPAVTKVLGATLSAKSQQALDRWKQGLISTLGEQGFQEFYQNQLKRGTDFHSAVRKLLVDHLDCKDDLCMRSLSKVLGSVSDVSFVESQVIHPLLGYRGVIDCVAKYKGKPVVIEWKRSDKTKPSLKHTYDAPLQLSAYFGAMNFDSNYKAQQVEGGVVVVAYSDGSPADVFELPVEECEHYWAKWLRRLHQYYSKPASA